MKNTESQAKKYVRQQTAYLTEKNKTLTKANSQLRKELQKRNMEIHELRSSNLTQGIVRFLTHLEENRGNYETEELNKLKALVAQERPYSPPVSYHDNWTDTEVTTEND